MAAFFVLFVIINWLCWLCWAFVVGYLGKDREIGMGTAVAWSLLLSPLIGLIIALSSPRADRRARGTPTEARKLFAQGEKKIKRRDYDAAFQIFERVVAIQPFAPTANYYLATLYSIKENKDAAFTCLTRAVEQGFKDFRAINCSPSLNFLRNQPEFADYARNGYSSRSISATAGEDVFTTLSRLGKLKSNELITEEEFAAQKKRLLGS